MAEAKRPRRVAKRGPGRPPTGHKTIQFRLPPELHAALEDRLEALKKKGCLITVSFYVRESLLEKLKKDSMPCLRGKKKTPRSG